MTATLTERIYAPAPRAPCWFPPAGNARWFIIGIYSYILLDFVHYIRPAPLLYSYHIPFFCAHYSSVVIPPKGSGFFCR